METLHIEARRKFKDINLKPLDKLPGKTISLAATVQYLDLIPQIKKHLEQKGKKVIIKQGPYYNAQVLGCNPQAFDKTADTLLLVVDGKFYARNNAIKLDREIHIFDTHKLHKITKQDLEQYSKQTKGKINKFLHANQVGLIVSTKQGQHHANIIGLKNKIEAKGKTAYIFETDTINLNELENFPQIKVWINTACYGLALDDNRILNFQDVLEFL